MPARAEDDPPAGFSRVEWMVLRRRGAHDAADAARLMAPTAGIVHDPLALIDMDRAVARVRAALQGGEPIVVYGDYDADGLTAATLLTTTLELMGANVSAFIPSRFEEGYGLQQEALLRLRAEGVGLVISVDCGMRAAAEVRAAAKAGLELIVTDHHDPGDELPPAVAVVNPKRPDDRYPFKELAGVGLAFKLAQALVDDQLSGWMDSGALPLVAIGTVADLAPLTGENRTLASRGLDRLRVRPPAGVAALLEVAGLRAARLTARDIGFSIAPRLNAVGRLGSPAAAFQLLRAETIEAARPLAASLDRANRERQDQTRAVIERARERMLALPELPALIFDADEDYGEGLLGPAAAKLVEEWHRPAVLVSLRGPVARGSARSVSGFHITEALEACAPMLDRFGGHAAAAGFSAPTDQLAALRAGLERIAWQRLEAPGTAPAVEIDAVVAPADVNRRLVEFLDRLEPLGSGFPPPLLACLGMTVVAARPVGRDRAHLKLVLRHGDRTAEAIAFRSGDKPPEKGARIDLAFYAERDIYLGLEGIRWNVQAMRAAQT
ncbi:MAG TPA: single-stranded-DNA-specific exonuclease RecJ [Anaerolineales bacterium]|nr:single-stranded-DNA-specific exonuclease RecJ [Anaerolineales bacterium]